MKKLMKKIILSVLLISLLMPVASCVRKKVDVGKLKTVEDFDNKDVKIGVSIGTNISVIAEKVFKNAKIEYFSSAPDIFSALEQGKIDATIQEMFGVNILAPDFKYIKVVDNSVVGQTEYAISFPKNDRGEKLCAEFNEFLAKIKSNGKVQELIDFWMMLDFPSDLDVDFSDLKNVNGEITMYTDAQARPFSFIFYTRNVGLDLVLARDFCKEKGYALNVVRTNAVLPALAAGKCDMVGGGIEVTEERKKTILFSDPTYVTDDVIVIADKTLIEHKGIIKELQEGFIATFISEDRYKLFIEGAITTIIISVLTLILGTAFGFFLYLIYYSGYKFIASIFNFLSWLFKRLPMLVFLMFVIYVVFAKIDINGIIIAIISFTIVFATSIFTLIDDNVKGIERGQIEAASSLGYNRPKTFFNIILPQILPNVLPVYQSNILELVKSTSIVGYVMVSDLTKVGDIVRGRTYGAFFPLVAVAIIYLMLAKIITIIVKAICDVLLDKMKIDKRKLKEIETDD